MAGSPIQRVAQRLRNISQLSTQIARVEIEDSKAAENWPRGLRAIAEQLIEAGQTLKQDAGEIEAYKNRRQEDAEALITLAQTAANIATVIGSDGQNLEVITHSDPVFIYGVLTRGTPEALEEAFNKLEREQKDRIARWLK